MFYFFILDFKFLPFDSSYDFLPMEGRLTCTRILLILIGGRRSWNWTDSKLCTIFKQHFPRLVFHHLVELSIRKWTHLSIIIITQFSVPHSQYPLRSQRLQIPLLLFRQCSILPPLPSTSAHLSPILSKQISLRCQRQIWINCITLPRQGFPQTLLPLSPLPYPAMTSLPLPPPLLAVPPLPTIHFLPPRASWTLSRKDRKWRRNLRAFF